MTREIGGNYSEAMQPELDALETRLAQLLERYQAMREENIKLRQQVVSLEDANKRLNERVDEARRRTETLLNRLPE